MIDNKRETKNKLKQTKDDLILQLTVGKEDIVEQYLLNLFELNGYKKLSNNHYIENNSEIIFSFSTETMDQDTTNSLIRKRTTDRLYIFCIKQNIKYLPDNVDIDIINIENIWNKIREKSAKIPTAIKLKKEPRYRLKDILCIILSKDKSNKYFKSAILLIVISLLTPFTNYYIIISTILLILSIYSRFNTRFN